MAGRSGGGGDAPTEPANERSEAQTTPRDAAPAPTASPPRPAYSGLQKSLFRFLQVPLEAPEPPPGRASWTSSFRPAPAFLRYLKIQAAVRLGLVVVLALVGAAGLVGAAEGALWSVALALVIMAVAGLWVFLDVISIRFRYDTTWYVMTDRALRNRRGVWHLQENTVTFDNVQNVRLRQGPLQRHLGIQDLLLETAAAGTGGSDTGAQAQKLVVEGIRNATELRDRIAERMRRSRGRGLGDDAPRTRGSRSVAAGAAGSDVGPHVGFGPHHLSLLREILEEVRGLEPTGPR